MSYKPAGTEAEPRVDYEARIERYIGYWHSMEDDCQHVADQETSIGTRTYVEANPPVPHPSRSGDVTFDLMIHFMDADPTEPFAIAAALRAMADAIDAK